MNKKVLVLLFNFIMSDYLCYTCYPTLLQKKNPLLKKLLQKRESVNVIYFCRLANFVNVSAWANFQCFKYLDLEF